MRAHFTITTDWSLDTCLTCHEMVAKFHFCEKTIACGYISRDSQKYHIESYQQEFNWWWIPPEWVNLINAFTQPIGNPHIQMSIYLGRIFFRRRKGKIQIWFLESTNFVVCLNSLKPTAKRSDKCERTVVPYLVSCALFRFIRDERSSFTVIMINQIMLSQLISI